MAQEDLMHVKQLLDDTQRRLEAPINCRFDLLEAYLVNFGCGDEDVIPPEANP